MLVTLFLALAAWSWRRWGDPIVDFGNEPYVSWQLLHGRALYRDLAWIYGPLPPWVNALAFAAFGASLSTLTFFNLALAAGLAMLVYRFCAAHADRLTATTATGVLLLCFVFPYHALDAPNYNFVWPYTYAATHGDVLLVCTVVILSRALGRDRASDWALGGILLGATLLTKVEIGLAAATAGTAAALVRVVDARQGRRRGPAVLLGCAVVPLAVCWALGGRASLIAPWTAFVRIGLGEHVFNARLMGIDAVWANGLRLARDATIWIAVAAALIAVDRHAATASAARRRWTAIAAVGLVGAIAVRDLPGIGRPLPVLLPVAVAALLRVARRRPAERDRILPLVPWAAAAWILLARILLDVRFHHYGFYLAMPAAVFVVLIGVGTVPRLLAERVDGGGRLVRTVALATIGLLAAYSAALSGLSYGHMTVAVGRGADAMLGPDDGASPTGALATALLDRIARHVPADATLAVLPDGTFLNFLTRRPNPTPFNEVIPPMVVAYGAQDVLAAYRAHPPQYVVLFEWSGEEYAVGTFGGPRWGGDIAAWVAGRYERVDAAPSSGMRIGFSIWRERTAPGT